MIPVFISVFRLTQHQAHGTSLAVIGAASVVAFTVYALHGNVAWITALAVGLVSAFTARIGARLATRTSAKRLGIAFAVFIAAIGVRLLWGLPPAGAARVAAAWTLPVDLLVGAAVGVLAGYMGVGGGILAVPAFTLLLGMPQQLAQGTSLGVILLTAPSGALEHHRAGNVVTRLIGPCALGAALGGLIASTWVQGLRGETVTRAFALFLLANALHLAIKSRSRPRA
jgi:uncharacterized membrane protein YfcA